MTYSVNGDPTFFYLTDMSQSSCYRITSVQMPLTKKNLKSVFGKHFYVSWFSIDRTCTIILSEAIWTKQGVSEYLEVNIWIKTE